MPPWAADTSFEGHGPYGYGYGHGWRDYGYREVRAPLTTRTSCKNCGSDLGRSQKDLDDHDGSPIALKMGLLGIPVLVRSKGKSTREDGDDEWQVPLPQWLQDAYAEGGTSSLAKELESRLKDRKSLSAECPPERSHHHSRADANSMWTSVQPEAELPAHCDERAPWPPQDHGALSSDLDGGHAPTTGTATRAGYAGVVLLRRRCKAQCVHLVERANGSLCFPSGPSQPGEESWIDTAIRALFEVSQMDAEHLKAVDEDPEELPVNDAFGCKYLVAEWGLEHGSGETSWTLRGNEQDEDGEPKGHGEKDGRDIVRAHWMLYTKAVKERRLSEGDRALLRAARFRFDLVGEQSDTGPARVGPERRRWVRSPAWARPPFAPQVARAAPQAAQHAPQSAPQAAPQAAQAESRTRRWGGSHTQAGAGACRQDGQGEPAQLRAQPGRHSTAEARCGPTIRHEDNIVEAAGIIAMRDHQHHPGVRHLKDVCMVTFLDDRMGFPQVTRQRGEDAMNAARRAWNVTVGRPLKYMANMDEDTAVWDCKANRVFYIANDVPAKDNTPWRSDDRDVKEVCWMPVHLALAETALSPDDKELLFEAMQKGHGKQSDRWAGANAAQNYGRRGHSHRHCGKGAVAFQ